ncbi:hypothetical protein KC357_g6853 [Hortaea werneckii]|nr:hypothetical protein KC357_g6853 [Hortaea werneckii]
MKLFSTIVAMLATLPAMPVLAANDTSLENQDKPVGDSIPPCALQCSAQAISQVDCELTDLDCVCNNKKLTELSTQCMLVSCTTKESLNAAKYQANLCDRPYHDHSGRVWKTCLFFQVFGTLVVASRFYVRSPLFKGPGLGWDDYFMGATYAFYTVGIAVAIKMSVIGLGIDMWNLAYANIQDILFWFFVSEIFYLAVISATKISICLLLLRIFPSTVARKFRWACWGALALCAGYWAALTIGILNACHPVNYNWLRWNPTEHEGKCYNMNAAIYSGAGLNILLDLIVLILPIPKVLGLEVSNAKKVGILATFSVGVFALICSCIRLKYIVLFGDSTNVTYDYATVALWSIIEGGATCICANMPPMAAMVRSLYEVSMSKMSSLYSSRGFSTKKSVTELSNRSQTGHPQDIQKSMTVTAVSNGRAPSSSSQVDLINGKEDFYLKNDLGERDEKGPHSHV